MKSIKTTTRNVKQSVRRFNDEQRKQIIYQIDNRPSNVSKLEMFKKFGMGHGGSIYYLWKKRFGMKERSKRVTNVPTNKPMFVNAVREYDNRISKKTTRHTITINVEVNSIMELIGLCTTIGKLPKVSAITSVV